MRAFWKPFSTNMTTGGTATATATVTAAITFQVRPAMNIITPPVSASMMAVPRSGCFATRSTGAPIMATGMSSFHDQRACLAVRLW